MPLISVNRFFPGVVNIVHVAFQALTKWPKTIVFGHFKFKLSYALNLFIGLGVGFIKFTS